MGSDQKGISGDEVASVVLDRSQKPAELLRLENRCVVLCLWRDQRSAEHGRRVAFAARGGNAIPEYAARKRSGLLRCLVLALRLKALEGGEHFERLNVIDWPAANGIHQLLEEEVGLHDGGICPTALHHHLIDVLTRHSFKGLG